MSTCAVCKNEFDENRHDATSSYNADRKRIDRFELPEDTYICVECADKEITRLKVEHIYGPIFDKLSEQANSSLFNSGNTDVKAMIKAFAGQHRYLQANIFIALMKFINQISELDETSYFDARNDFILAYAKKASDVWKKL